MEAAQFKVTEYEVLACTPVPDRAILAGDPLAVLATVTEPESVPALVGLKITLKDVLWPALKVIGVLAPLNEKPVPPAVIWETVTLALPVLVTVTG